MLLHFILVTTGQLLLCHPTHVCATTEDIALFAVYCNYTQLATSASECEWTLSLRFVHATDCFNNLCCMSHVCMQHVYKTPRPAGCLFGWVSSGVSVFQMRYFLHASATNTVNVEAKKNRVRTKPSHHFHPTHVLLLGSNAVSTATCRTYNTQETCC